MKKQKSKKEGRGCKVGDNFPQRRLKQVSESTFVCVCVCVQHPGTRLLHLLDFCLFFLILPPSLLGTFLSRVR